MLLDDIRINSQDELNDQLHLLFDTTAVGLEQVSLADMAESQMLIGKELSNMLMREYNVDPQKTWHCVVSILRCLPWRVDPEKAYVESQDGIVDAIYRYFGGMQFTEMDSIFNDLRIMADDGKPWKDIVKYACENIPRKV